MSASISTTSETLVVSIETDRGKLHTFSVAGWFGVISSDYNQPSSVTLQ